MGFLGGVGTWLIVVCICNLVFVHNTGTLMDAPSPTKDNITKFNDLARPLGLSLNPFKTRILTSCNGQSIIPDLAGRELDVASSLKSAIELYSQEKPQLTVSSNPSPSN